MRLPEHEANRANLAVCEGLCEALAEGAASGDVEEAAAICGLCGRKLTKKFFENISRGKTAWAAVPQRQFLGAKPAISACRKKYKIKGGGRKALTSRSQRPAMRAVSKACGISPLPRLGGRF